MSEYFPLMVPGAKAAGTIEVTAPYDGSVLGTVETTDARAAEQALATAYSLYRDRANWIPAYRRVDILEKTAHIMQARAEELAIGAAAEGGKPLLDSRVEVARAIDGVKLCIEELRHNTGHEIPMGVTASSANRIAVTRAEPIGVVVAVSAFNHPLNLIVHQVAPAVAAGCPSIVKPAEDTALSCLRFVRILREAGWPDEWCQAVVTTGREVSELLVTDKRVAFFSFIGSARVGWMLRSKLAPGTRCALEHGGAAPVIVACDADIDGAVASLLKGGFYHAGQVCVSVQRIFAEKKCAKELAQALARGADKLVVGDPTVAKTEVGPLIRPAEVDRVHQWVQEAVKSGAKLMAGGKPLDHQCYAPTVLYKVPADATISRNEVFGPVICIYPYSDIATAVKQANSLDYAFQASVFTRDIDFAMRCFRDLDGSAVMVNDHTAFRVDWMPFAGLRHSGFGVGGIGYTFHDMQIEKMLVIRSPMLP